MASNVKNLESSNDTDKKELLMTSTQECEQESLEETDKSAVSSVEPVECSNRQNFEQPVVGPLLSYYADDPVARTQSMIMLSVLEVKGSVDKLCRKITEQFNKGEIDTKKLFRLLQEKEQATDTKIDAQSLLLQQLLVQIRDDVLPRLQTTLLRSLRGTTQLAMHSSDRARILEKQMPEDDSHVKSKHEAQFYFEEQSDVFAEWKFKCSEAMLHSQQETVLIAIKKEDFMQVNHFLQQKKINTKYLCLIDKELVRPDHDVKEKVANHIPATTSATATDTTASTTTTVITNATTTTTTATTTNTNTTSINNNATTSTATTDAFTNTNTTTTNAFTNTTPATTTTTTTTTTNTTSVINNTTTTTTTTTTNTTSVINNTTTTTTTTTTTNAITNITTTDTATATVATAAAATVHGITSVAAGPQGNTTKVTSTKSGSDVKVPVTSEASAESANNADKTSDPSEEVHSKSSPKQNRKGPRLIDQSNSGELSISRFEDIINNANEVPYCAIQLSKLMKLIKEKDELQAQVSSLKATLEAKDDVIQQIKLDRQAIDDKESTRQRDAQEQMRTEQGNLKDLISVVKDMVHVQGARVQISESYMHSQQGFSTTSAATTTTTDAYTLQTRRSGNYPPTTE